MNVTDNDREFGKRVLVAGCDPGISVLARSAQLAGVELVLVHRNSSQALQLLKKGRIHIAGTHLRDEATGDNMPGIDAVLSKDSVAVISFAVWEEGIVAAIGNPKRHSRCRRPGETRCFHRQSGGGGRRAEAAGFSVEESRHRITFRSGLSEPSAWARRGRLAGPERRGGLLHCSRRRGALAWIVVHHHS